MMLPRTEPSVSIFEETTTSALRRQGGQPERQGDGQGFQSQVHQTTLLDSPVNSRFSEFRAL